MSDAPKKKPSETKETSLRFSEFDRSILEQNRDAGRFRAGRVPNGKEDSMCESYREIAKTVVGFLILVFGLMLAVHVAMLVVLLPFWAIGTTFAVLVVAASFLGD